MSRTEKTYTCTTCGEPIVFRCERRQDDKDLKPRRTGQKPRIFPVHIHGKCGQRGFKWN